MITEVNTFDKTNKSRIYKAVRNIFIIYVLFSFFSGKLHTLPYLTAAVSPVIYPFFSKKAEKKIFSALKSLFITVIGSAAALITAWISGLNIYTGLVLVSLCSYTAGILYLMVKEKISPKHTVFVKTAILLVCFYVPYVM